MSRIKKTAKKEPVQTPKGMHDILPENIPYYERIVKETRRVAEFYGFMPIKTPHVEKADLFLRPLGETSDVVDKQMYTFRTRGGSRLALRPEGTAPVVRAYLQHGMQSWPQPVKLFYEGSFFRHENPQAGRYREFYQVGVEVIGDEDPVNDVLVMRVLVSSLHMLGLKNISIHINTIGCSVCRQAYRKELIAFYRKHTGELCRDCRRRMKENPLRLLDCKNGDCQEIKKHAPQMVDYLCDDCKAHFSFTLEFLDEMQLPYYLNPHLVRGFDYYSRTVFELFEEVPEEGLSLALGGGGRYDDLSEFLGAKKLFGVGGALGSDRIVELLKKHDIKVKPETKPKIFLIQLGPAAKKKSFYLMEELRKIGVPVAQSLSKDLLRQQFKIAEKLKIPLTLILGQKEALEETIVIRNMNSGMQETLSFNKFIGTIKAKIKNL